MRLLKGDRVAHPALPEWGVGEIVENAGGELARVFFPAVGARTVERLVLVRALARPARASVAASPIADRVEDWLDEFPGGFADREYALGERRRVLDGVRRAAVFLARDPMLDAVAAGRCAAVCAAAHDVALSSGLLSGEAAAALREIDERGARLLARALLDLLHGPAPYPERFDGFATCLDELGAGDWSLATLLPMLAAPDEHVLVDPALTPRIADAFAFDLLWRDEPNWDTYGRVLSLARYLQDLLAPLGPLDMLDISAFMRRSS